MLRAEEITQQQELLRLHRHTLSVYLRQQAILGSAYITPAIDYGIYEARENIRRIKTHLVNWGVSIEGHPDDEPSPLGTVPVPALQAPPLETLSPITEDSRRALVAQLVMLLEVYQAANKQVIGVANSGERIQLEDQMANLEQRMQEVEIAFVQLVAASTSVDIPVPVLASQTVIADLTTQNSLGLDTRIVQTLYEYYTNYSGDPTVPFSTVVERCKAPKSDLLRHLWRLKEMEWLDFNLTERAEDGLVWLKARGVKVAQDLPKS